MEKDLCNKGEGEGEVAQSCPTLCDPMDCSPPGASVHGILQARIPEWVAISFSRVSSRPRDQTQFSHITGRRFNLCTTREALSYPELLQPESTFSPRFLHLQAESFMNTYSIRQLGAKLYIISKILKFLFPTALI